MSIDRLPPVGHVGVVVADMDRALEEIRQIFGIDGAGKVYDFIPMNVWAWGEKIPGCQIRIAMLDWTDSLKLEVLQPVFSSWARGARSFLSRRPRMKRGTVDAATPVCLGRR